MKTKHPGNATMILVLVGFVSLGIGCAKKTGIQMGEKATSSMEAVNSDTKEAAMQIDATKSSLDDLLKTGQMAAAQPDDVKKAHDRFTENVNKMNDIARKMNADIDKMHSEGNAYFLAWSKEGGTYTDPNMQRLSEERRTRLDRSFREMQSSADAVRPSLNLYLADIKQIQTYLSNDLTPQGIASIVPAANKATQDGDKLKRSFTPVQNAIMQARADMTPGGAAAGGTSGTSQPRSQQTGTAPSATDAGR